MSRSQEHYIALMYRYVNELSNDIDEGAITAEALGRSTLLQRSISKGIELIGETAWQLDKLGADLGPDIPLRKHQGITCDIWRRRAAHPALVVGQRTPSTIPSSVRRLRSPVIRHLSQVIS